MSQIKFKNDEKDLLFFKELKKRVDDHFILNKLSKKGNRTLRVKAIVLALSYGVLFLSIFFCQSVWMLYTAYALLGMCTIFVALNIAHDAAHDTFSERKKVNSWLLNTFDVLGANGYLWKMKHVHSHHPHVNIPNMDGDIKQSNLVRIFPNAQFLNFHKYQYIYMPVLYMAYTMVWLLFRDFKDFVQTDISGKAEVKHAYREIVKLILGKLFFLTRMISLPYLVLPFTLGQILLGFLIFNIAASLTVAMALISAHVGEDSVYPSPDKGGIMEHSWVRHQIITTVDFSTHNPILTHLFGGFNHHVVHHLFPNICHIHYPQLTEILKETCAEYGMPYKSNPSLLDAMWSHMRFLKMRSRQEIAVEYIEM